MEESPDALTIVILTMAVPRVNHPAPGNEKNAL
jgi:hypothetical protein